MKIFKFGGASLKDANGFKNVLEISLQKGGKPLAIVASAIGKTTNALESYLQLCTEKSTKAEKKLEEILHQHLSIAKELLGSVPESLQEKFDKQISWLSKGFTEGFVGHQDYIYDQVVSRGEILSTLMLSELFKKEKHSCQLLDARQLVKTDNRYRDGRVNWKKSGEAIQNAFNGLSADIIITQGFIGGTPEGFFCTLGREGSDFSAAILAHSLNAESLTIWKDVPGVLNADPRFFEDANLISKLNYKEAIEMTYYGAKVIHPKTIKPLQNKSIPLFVKPFDDPGAQGTTINSEKNIGFLPPVLVKVESQCLIHISTKDFSFMAEDNLSIIFSALAKANLKVNMMQNMAISFSICVDDDAGKLEKLEKKLKEDFHLKVRHQLELFTIRHYNEQLVESLTRGKEVVAEERIRNTVQFILPA